MRVVAITREAAKSAELMDFVRAQGGTPLSLPMIETVFSSAPPALVASSTPCWWIFSSPTGVQALAALVPWPQSVKVGVVGPATAKAVRNLGQEVAFESAIHTAQHLAETLPEEEGYDRAVWWCGNLANQDVHAKIAGMKEISSICVYSTQPTVLSELQIHQMKEETEVVVFMSGSAVRNWTAHAALEKELTVICIGPSTLQVAQEQCCKQKTTPTLICCEPHSLEGVKKALINVLLPE
jgi:uroporphyrinogen-III synthase